MRLMHDGHDARKGGGAGDFGSAGDCGDPGRLAVIAGAGQFPFMVVDGARRAGRHVTVLALRNLADPSLRDAADAFCWTGIARLGGWIRLMLRAGARRVVLAGYVRKSAMYGRWRLLRNPPDWTAIRLWFFKLRDKRNDAILSAVADEFARHGILMENCTKYTPEHLAPPGVLTRRQPSPSQARDMEFGWPLARELGRLDIGQCIAVKETEVIAVEAIEGTDRMIRRAGELCPRGNWALIKTAKPSQDMRFDVPTVGPDTIDNLQAAGASMLVIEAGKTLMIDRQRMIERADSAGIVIVARPAD
ncbi:MAG: UDP-2,3-diacylglucosamine diphosphatase LpxI [Phycisphaerales bacterium]|nr:UDP-2,3-diacylglucosamine diphosphatase LpxI [Phycisphaerales bacterium]